jgi:hypothetical protein
LVCTLPPETKGNEVFIIPFFSAKELTVTGKKPIVDFVAEYPLRFERNQAVVMLPSW